MPSDSPAFNGQGWESAVVLTTGRTQKDRGISGFLGSVAGHEETISDRTGPIGWGARSIIHVAASFDVMKLRSTVKARSGSSCQTPWPALSNGA